MEQNYSVGYNRKQIHTRRRPTVRCFAGESGVSGSILSQRGQDESVFSAVKMEDNDFQSLALFRGMQQERLAGGKVMRRKNFPFDKKTRLEIDILELFISADYEPPLSAPGCICYLTVLSGQPQITAEEETYTLMRYDSLRFAADRPYRLVNMSNATVRLMLVYQYTK